MTDRKRGDFMSLLLRRRVMMQEGEDKVKEWETLVDYTAEETKQSVAFTKDDNGKPFRLSAVSVFVDMNPPEDSTITTAMSINVGCTENINAQRASIGQTPVYGGVHKYGHVVFERKDYGMYPIIQESSFNSSNIAMNLSKVTDAYGYNIVANGDIVVAADCCEGISVGSHYQYVITKGTRILVKGIRV